MTRVGVNDNREVELVPRKAGMVKGNTKIRQEQRIKKDDRKHKKESFEMKYKGNSRKVDIQEEKISLIFFSK